jgi:hypothetical protein
VFAQIIGDDRVGFLGFIIMMNRKSRDALSLFSIGSLVSPTPCETIIKNNRAHPKRYKLNLKKQNCTQANWLLWTLINIFSLEQDVCGTRRNVLRLHVDVRNRNSRNYVFDDLLSLSLVVGKTNGKVQSRPHMRRGAPSLFQTSSKKKIESVESTIVNNPTPFV